MRNIMLKFSWANRLITQWELLLLLSGLHARDNFSLLERSSCLSLFCILYLILLIQFFLLLFFPLLLELFFCRFFFLLLLFLVFLHKRKLFSKCVNRKTDKHMLRFYLLNRRWFWIWVEFPKAYLAITWDCNKEILSHLNVFYSAHLRVDLYFFFFSSLAHPQGSHLVSDNHLLLWEESNTINNFIKFVFLLRELIASVTYLD